MPRLNSIGEALMGVGGGGITSIDGTEVAQLVGAESGDWAWLDDTTIAGKADTGGGYALYSLSLPGGSLTPIGTGESSYFWAGGGTWTAYAAAFPGVKSNVSALTQPLAGVGDVAADGWAALVQNFAADSNIQVYDDTGDLQTSVSVTVFPENGVIRLRGSVLSYADAERTWVLRNRATNALLNFAQRTSIQTALVPVTVGSTVYVVERDVVEPAEMLTIRAANASTGYVITDDGIGYNPDAVWLTSSIVRVAYSTGQGELPDELVMHDINVLTGAHSKATIVAGAPVWVTQTPMTPSSLPATGGSSGLSTATLTGLYQRDVIDPKTPTGRRMSKPWYDAFTAIAQAATGPVNLSNATGVLDQSNGGTGTTTGLTNVGVAVDAAGALDGNGMTPTPLAVKVDGSTIIINSDNELEATGGGGGTVTNTGTLTDHALIVGNGGVDVSALGSLGTSTTVLHGNASGDPTFAAVSLTADVTGDLPYSNLAQGSALSVLGVTGNATADVASIAAGTDHQVLRRSGTSVAFGAVNLAQSAAVTGDLPFANLTQASAASKLLGRGSASGAGDFEEISLGSGLSMSGTTLSATGGGGGNSISSTAVGSEPGSPSTGDLDLYSNGFAQARYSGSAWVPWGPLFPLTAPISGEFAWINQGGASINTTNGGIYLLSPATTGPNIRLRKKAAPSTPWTVTAVLLANLFNVSSQAVGLAFRQSSDGKLIVFGPSTSASTSVFGVYKFNSATSFSATYLEVSAWNIRGLVFVRIQDNGTNRICSVSSDGVNFIAIHTVGRTDFLTADEVGFFVNEQSNAYDVAMTLLSWKEA